MTYLLGIAAPMKQRSDRRFGNVLEPTSISEMLDAVAADEATFPHPHVRMWRGQADERWLLDSGCYRMLRLSEPAPTERDVAYHERWLLNRATHRGYRYHEGRELSDFELLARLQHHGAATRLIDATRSIMVGLFFACYTEPDRSGLLFGISSNHLGGGEGHLLSGTYEEVIKAACKHDHPQTWDPPAVSKRVSAQHSQFVYSRIQTDQAYGTLTLASNTHLMVFSIKSEQKGAYLRQLRGAFDISPETMFPDLDGFCAIHNHKHSRFATARW
jgi:hypothetical protein